MPQPESRGSMRASPCGRWSETPTRRSCTGKLQVPAHGDQGSQRQGVAVDVRGQQGLRLVAVSGPSEATALGSLFLGDKVTRLVTYDRSEDVLAPWGNCSGAGPIWLNRGRTLNGTVKHYKVKQGKVLREEGRSLRVGLRVRNQLNGQRLAWPPRARQSDWERRDDTWAAGRTV